MENIKYSRNFGRAWSYVQLCQAIPLVFSVAMSGLYFSVGNYVSVASLLAASLMLSLINIHKHNRGKRRRLRRLNTVDKEEKGEDGEVAAVGRLTVFKPCVAVNEIHFEVGRDREDPGQSPVRIPIRSTRSYEVSGQ